MGSHYIYLWFCVREPRVRKQRTPSVLTSRNSASAATRTASTRTCSASTATASTLDATTAGSSASSRRAARGERRNPTMRRPRSRDASADPNPRRPRSDGSRGQCGGAGGCRQPPRPGPTRPSRCVADAGFSGGTERRYHRMAVFSGRRACADPTGRREPGGPPAASISSTALAAHTSWMMV